MRRGGRSRAISLALATLISAPVLGLASTSANADPSDSTRANPTAKGRVIAPVAIRAHRTPAAKRIGTYKKGTVLTILCKTKGVPVDGNPRWYMLDLSATKWVSARWVANVGTSPIWCLGRPQTAKVVGDPFVQIRTKPTTNSRSVGTIPHNKVIEIVCKVNGQWVDGNPRWYQLYTGRWVAARYVKNIEWTPTSCRQPFKPFGKH